MAKRITWSEGGCWGIHGVDLTTLPPKAYAAAAKLKDMENILERVNYDGIDCEDVEESISELRRMV